MGPMTDRIRKLVKAVGICLLAAAVVKELSQPADQREWHGEVAGIVPYDLRVPTLQRARERWWNPDVDRVFVPQVFGVGWTVNLNRVARLLGLVSSER